MLLKHRMLCNMRLLRCPSQCNQQPFQAGQSLHDAAKFFVTTIALMAGLYSFDLSSDAHYWSCQRSAMAASVLRTRLFIVAAAQAMSDIWGRGEHVQCIHPAAGCIAGRENVSTALVDGALSL